MATKTRPEWNSCLSHLIMRWRMLIVNEKLITRFARKHPDAASWLEKWLDLTETSSWRNFNDVKGAFPAVDGGVKVGSGGSVTIFDVGGNKYRMIASIKYHVQLVTILELLTHAEYSKNLWKERH